MTDYSNLTLDELKNLDYGSLPEEDLVALQQLATNYYSFEQAIKLIINSAYGAFGSVFFHWFNIDIAETITLQGQDAIKHTVAMTEKYFKEFFHRDKQLHKKLGLEENAIVNKCKNPVATYCDTDSVASNSIIRDFALGEISIEDHFNLHAKLRGFTKDERGNEVVTFDKEGMVKILNFDKSLVYSNVKHLIRHQVTKEKWYIKTKSGKSIEVTNDHSIIVLRNGKKIELKASEINKATDMLISVRGYAK